MQASSGERLRGLHNTAVHNQYGVASQWPAIQVVAGALSIGPFVAYDVRGHELLNCCEELTVSLPPQPDAESVERRFFLIARHASEPSPAPCADGPLPAPRCCPPPCISPEFCWVMPDRFAPELGVPIAAIAWENSGFVDIGAREDFPRHRARRYGGEVVASGEIRTRGSDWQLHLEDKEPWAEAQLDLDSQRFLCAPCCCFAWIGEMGRIERAGKSWDITSHLLIEFGCKRLVIRVWLEPTPSATISAPIHIEDDCADDHDPLLVDSGPSVCWMCVQARPPGVFTCDPAALMRTAREQPEGSEHRDVAERRIDHA